MPRFPKYPSCRYHPEKGNRVVKDEIEDEALTPASDGWVRNPSEFSADPAVTDPVTEEAEPVTEPDAVIQPGDHFTIEGHSGDFVAPSEAAPKSSAPAPAPVRRRGKGKTKKAKVEGRRERANPYSVGMATRFSDPNNGSLEEGS